MKELTLVFNSSSHEELEEYLLTLKGIKEVSINHDQMVEINIKYDSKETSPKVIQTEIELFLDITKYSCLFSFDKHEKDTKTYHGSKHDVCCEYCYMSFIDDLFNVDGVSKVSSNYADFYKEHKVNLDIVIEYDPNKVTEKALEEYIEKIYE